MNKNLRVPYGLSVHGKEEIKAAEARQQEIESMLPQNLRAELSYLSRKVKTLEKTVKELKSKQSINHDSWSVLYWLPQA